MIRLLNSIVHAIVAIFNLIIDGFEAILTVVSSIPQYVDFLSTSISVFPAFLLPYALFGISITVIAMLIRKEVF